jgi:tetratricopeptide (TPR) repeat protein
MKTPLFVLWCGVFLGIGAADAQDAPGPVAAPAAQAAPTAQTSDVWLPGKAWALQVDGKGFTTRDNEIQPDGRRYFLAENAQTRVIVSVFLETAKSPMQPDDCKHSLEEKAKSNATLASAKLKDVAYRSSGDLQILEFTLPQFDGMPKNQKNIFGCLIKDDVFVDIHISKLFFRASDQPLFDALLQSIQFVPREATDTAVPAGNSMLLFREGSRYFLAHQYREAIGPYRQAFEIEKITPTLEKNLWRVLLDNLSIAYGITGDLTRARETLNYGVSKDPDYPTFYYNLACVAAEKGALSETEKNLRLAFDRRANIIPGETFPDARVDDSFQKFLQQKEFRKFLDSLYGPGQ